MEQSGVILNRDQINPVFYGRTQTECTQSVASILDPGASITTDDTAEVWVVALVNSVNVDFIQNAGQWSPSVIDATVSGAVNIAGTPNVNIQSQAISLDVSAATVTIIPANDFIPIGLTQQILAQGATTIPFGSGVSTSVIDISDYQSIDIVINAHCPSQSSAAAPLTGNYIFQFYDDISATVLIGREQWWGWLANSGGSVTPVYGSVVARGHYMIVTIANPGPSGVNYTLDSMTLYGSNRVIPKSDLRQDPPTAITSGFTMLSPGLQSLPSQNMWATIQAIAMAANAQNWQPLGLMSGTVAGRYQQTQPMNNDTQVIFGANLINGGVNLPPQFPSLINFSSSSTAETPLPNVTLPRAPCFISMHATATPGFITFVGSVIE